MQEQRKTAKATTSEMILEALREQIINGTLVPQEKLVEAEIAQQFGTSRGPVRDALQAACHGGDGGLSAQQRLLGRAALAGRCV